MSWFSSMSNRAAGRAAGAHAVVPLHEPDTLLVEKILVAQRPDRAQIDHAARQFVGQRIAGKHVDFLVAAAVDDHQLGGAGNFAVKPHAAAAHHAAIDEQRDRIAHVAPAAGEWPDIGPAFAIGRARSDNLADGIRPPCRKSGNRSDDRSAGLLRLAPGSFSPASLLVTNTVPSLAGVWQAGTSFGIIVIAPVSAFRVPVSTRHMRQLATTVSPGCQQ